jgi:Phosphopantetheinyl transferase component of siderophore synthetase
MISLVTPSCAAAVDSFVSRMTSLYREEELMLANACRRRRCEFITARWCIDRAFDNFGMSRSVLTYGEKGRPIWPTGFVGSITHCRGYVAAVIASSISVQLIGIDAEPAVSLPPGVLSLISSEVERQRLEKLFKNMPEIAWDRLLFCAKEALYKAWPVAVDGRAPSFLNASVILAVDNGFSAEILDMNYGPMVLHGRWALYRNYFIVCVFNLTEAQ